MVIAMALMSGYTEDLQHKLIGLQGEIIASPLKVEAFVEQRSALEQAVGLEGVARMDRVAYGEGSVSSSSLPEGVAVILRGVDPHDDPAVAEAALLAADEHGVPGALLGEELHRLLAVETGSVLRLVVLQLGERTPRFHYRSLRVAGTFTSGFAQFDNSWIILDREVLERARGTTGYDIAEFQLTDTGLTEEVSAQLEDLLGPDFVVSSWQRLNRELFAALALQEQMLFLVLGLIVLVSTFNVASTLVILVRERRRDIGVLAALGLDRRQMWWIFAVYGLMLGALGTLIGVSFGAAASWILTEFELISFGPEIAAIYFIDSVPFRVEGLDIAAIVAFSLVTTLLACILPAFRASAIRPAHALRDE